MSNSTKTRKPREEVQLTSVSMASRCPVCGATDAEVLQTFPAFEYGGEEKGQRYTHIVRRRVRCKNPGCGQVRIDRELRNVPQ
jgi:hypothetical protein